MQETLVIEITKENPSQPSWICFNANKEIIEEAFLGDASKLASLAIDRHVIVLLPATDIGLLNVQLPPMNKQRLLQALPFAIEEQVLQDVERLHMAPLNGEQQKDGMMPTLIVEHIKMQEWMQLLKTMGVSANVMTSSLFAIPYVDPDASLLVNDVLLLRLDQYKGFVCDATNLELMLTGNGRNQFTQTLVVYKDPNQAALPMIQEIECQEKILTRQDMFRMMASFILAETPINLLQGRYFSRKIRLPKGLLYQTMFFLAIGWVLLMLSYPLISYSLLSLRLNSLNNMITSIYKKHFPEMKSISAPKIRMEERIAQLTSAENENKLMLWLGYFGKALADVPSVDIKHLNYTEQDMTLEVTASSAQDVSRFVEKLSQQGLHITQQNANLSGEKVSVNLLVGAA